MKKADEVFIREALRFADQARRKGNHPFGAVLVDSEGQILLTAENTVVTSGDCTGHAETNLVRAASRAFSPDFLAGCTLFASTEPCPMCAGAIFWANIGRVVFGLSQEGLYELVGEENHEALHLSCREILAKGAKAIQVDGPCLETEAMRVHAGFW